LLGYSASEAVGQSIEIIIPHHLRERHWAGFATHVFNMPAEKPRDFLGHHWVYDEKATQDAQQRAGVFIAAHVK